jgi:RHS repeat-associated protein
LGQPETDIQSLPFGDQLNSYPDQYAPATADDSAPLYFTGKERDAESGNDYFEARYYGSSMGRMLSPDPSQLYYADPTNPQSLNLYSYVLNNPLVHVDPNGLDCVYDDGGGNFHTATGDCDNSTLALANAGHYIDCDGCTTNSTAGTLDPATGTMYLTDANGNGIAGTNISDWANPVGLSNTIAIGGTTGNVDVTGDGMGIGISYSNLPQLPDGELRNPNAPPALPKLKGRDKGLCLWGSMTNEMLGGDSGPSDSSDTAPGKGGAEPIPFHTTTRGGKAVTRQMGVNDSADAKAGGTVEAGNYLLNVFACLAN